VLHPQNLQLHAECETQSWTKGQVVAMSLQWKNAQAEDFSSHAVQQKTLWIHDFFSQTVVKDLGEEQSGPSWKRLSRMFKSLKGQVCHQVACLRRSGE